MSPGSQIRVGAVLALLAVILGAFAAHGLDAYLVKTWAGVTKTVAGQEFSGSWKYLQDFKTGAEYQMYHALGLIAVGLCGQFGGGETKRSLNVAGWCFMIGTLFFSGSLYVLAVTKMTWLGAITPIGGTLFIAGWIAFAIGAGRSSQTAT